MQLSPTLMLRRKPRFLSFSASVSAIMPEPNVPSFFFNFLELLNSTHLLTWVHYEGFKILLCSLALYKNPFIEVVVHNAWYTQPEV